MGQPAFRQFKVGDRKRCPSCKLPTLELLPTKAWICHSRACNRAHLLKRESRAFIRSVERAAETARTATSSPRTGGGCTWPGSAERGASVRRAGGDSVGIGVPHASETVERDGDNVPLRSTRDLADRGGLTTRQPRQSGVSGA